ncbi:MAG: leucine-rich repeat protein, partial [Oscillospiraceae bacterium]|nr:leucine-rich repeat protein [Oscillospiraceae bacterium]
MKRIIFSLAAFVFIFCLAALPAFAADFTQLEYEEIDGSITITACAADCEGSLNIPAEIKGKSVTVIGSGAFSGCEYIEEIILPESVEKIEPYAFYGCTT